jgi:hypothetical protein
MTWLGSRELILTVQTSQIFYVYYGKGLFLISQSPLRKQSRMTRSNTGMTNFHMKNTKNQIERQPECYQTDPVVGFTSD